MSLQFFNRAVHALRWLLLHRLPTCKATVQVMSESLERRLTLRERVSLKLHLWVCAWCAWYLEHLQFMRAALRTQTAQVSDDKSAPTTSLSPDARERLKHALASKDR